jgi:ATP-dependent helicase/nuclease subunit A
MRIGTIHVFSQSLLRRFPLEAAISPHFQLIDDRDADDALTEAREDMLAGAGTPAMQTALRILAGLASAEAFGGHVKTLQSDRRRLRAALDLGDDLERAQQRVLGVTATNEEALIGHAVQWLGETALRDAAREVFANSPRTVGERAAAILDWLSQDTAQRQVNWIDWCNLFLKKEPYTLAGRKNLRDHARVVTAIWRKLIGFWRSKMAAERSGWLRCRARWRRWRGRLPAATPNGRKRLGCWTTMI